MKKISLFLFTLCVSVASVFADNDANDPYTLNPYAYDLRSTWNPSTQKLSISFKVNSVPNLNDIQGNVGKGIQVFVETLDGTRQFPIWKVPEDVIKAAHGSNNTGGSYTKEIDLSSGIDVDGNTIPCDEILTWKVRVCGRSNAPYGIQYDGAGNKFDYALPRYWNVRNSSFPDQKRYITPSIAIVNNPMAPNFGHLLVVDNIKVSGDPSPFDTPHGSTYASNGVGRGVYVFDANFTTSFGRKAINSNLNGGFTDPLEPRDICIANTGRIFVCSYSNTSTTAVWELSTSYSSWTEVVKKSDLKIGTTNYRVVSIDAKGDTDNITLLLLCAPTNNSTNLICYEYNILTKTKTQITLPNEIKNIQYFSDGINAHAKISYGENDLLWFAFGKTDGSVVMVSDRNGNLKLNKTYGSYYGGEAFVAKGDLLIKSYTNNSTSNSIISFKRVDYTSNTLSLTDNYFSPDGEITDPNNYLQYSNSYKNAVYNDFAIDYANNVYVASNWQAHIFPISLPYDGVRTTPAPAGQTFTLADPAPNILATDLCVTPHDTQAKYIFSFNVNTKPEGAEIRFYTSEQDMLNDSKQNATYSDYDNHDNCSYYYRFSELKQGRMSVELDILGHEGGKELTDKKLPSGKLYWNVFLKTRRSLAFSPIYVQPLDGEDLHYRLHATIDNNPDNDGFGHIYAIDYYRQYGTNDDIKNIHLNPCKLMIYSIGEAGITDETSDNISSSTRYTLIQSTKTDQMVQPRRPAVAPDGMLYLPDYGDYEAETADLKADPNNEKDHKKITGPHSFEYGGIWLFDPVLNKGKTEVTDMPRFYKNYETTSGVCFYGEGADLKLYKTNTYEEITFHPNDYRTNSAYQTNGYRIYKIGNPDGTIKHQIGDSPNPDGTITHAISPLGDSNGSISIAATKQGVWLCQHRSGTYSNGKNDGEDAVALMFYNNQGDRTFESYTAYVDGQKLSTSNTAIMQSTPGAGMTVSKDEERLYVVNHEGNILEFEIGDDSDAMTLSLINKFVNTTTYTTISTMNFDYAGNLVVTTDQSYPANASQKTQIVVFTLPYNRDNARSIPASKAQREIPERLSYAEDKENTLATIAKTPTLVDLFRPMPNTSYSTICLPFALDISTLEDGHPYKTADIRAFEGAELSAVGGEKILYLNFSADPVTSLSANTPYIIQPSVRIPNLVQLPATHWNTDAAPVFSAFGNNNSITFTGVIPKQDIVVQKGQTLLLVAENRLAEMEPDAGKTIDSKPAGEILGFRGYFTLGAPLPKGMQAILRNKDNTVTGLVDINGKKVNINKYLREGRVYIRMGDTLYTITGEKVK